jgi:hypothetical protein
MRFQRHADPQRVLAYHRIWAGWLWRGLGDSRYPIIPITSLHNGNEMVAATRELPASGYALEVDGRFKAEFTTRDGARAGGEELKKRFPMLQIRIYDAQTHAREEI